MQRRIKMHSPKLKQLFQILNCAHASVRVCRNIWMVCTTNGRQQQRNVFWKEAIPFLSPDVAIYLKKINVIDHTGKHAQTGTNLFPKTVELSIHVQKFWNVKPSLISEKKFVLFEPVLLCVRNLRFSDIK